MNLPPDSFYYALSFLFGGALIWIIKVYIGRTDKMLDGLGKTVADMKTMLAVHEQRHEDSDGRIERLENGNGNGKRKH